MEGNWPRGCFPRALAVHQKAVHPPGGDAAVGRAVALTAIGLRHVSGKGRVLQVLGFRAQADLRHHGRHAASVLLQGAPGGICGQNTSTRIPSI